MRGRSDENADIIRAIQAGDNAAVNQYIQNDPSKLNAKIDNDGNTLLHIAILAEQHNVAKSICNYSKTKLTSKNDAGLTASDICKAKIDSYENKISNDQGTDSEVAGFKQAKRQLMDMRKDMHEKMNHVIVDSDAVSKIRKNINLKDFSKAMSEAGEASVVKMQMMQHKETHDLVDRIIKEARVAANGDPKVEFQQIREMKIKYQSELEKNPDARAALTGYTKSLGVRTGEIKINKQESKSEEAPRVRVSGADPRAVKSAGELGSAESSADSQANRQAAKDFYSELTKIVNSNAKPDDKRKQLTELKEANRDLIKSDRNLDFIAGNALKSMEEQRSSRGGMSRTSRDASTPDMTRLQSSSPLASPAIRRKKTDSSPAPAELNAQPSKATPAATVGKTGVIQSASADTADTSNNSDASPRPGRR